MFERVESLVKEMAGQIKPVGIDSLFEKSMEAADRHCTRG
jgi:hypothetical protein